MQILSPAFKTRRKIRTLSTHRALSLCRLLLNPFHDAVLHSRQCHQTSSSTSRKTTNHVKTMAAFSRYYQEQLARHFIATTLREIERGILTKATVVAGILARRTRPVKVHLTDTADVVFGDIPLPCGDGIPLFDGDFHRERFRRPFIKGGGISHSMDKS